MINEERYTDEHESTWVFCFIVKISVHLRPKFCLTY